MKEYIFINRVPENYNSTDAKAAIDQWNTTTNKWKTDGIFVTSFVFPGNGISVEGINRTITNGNILSGTLKIVSVIVIKAASYDSAVELSTHCPILDQNGSIEVRELMARP